MKKNFIPATTDMLQQAAAGELVLFAPIRRHTAKLHAFTWAVAPKQSNRSCAAGLVPITPQLAEELLCFPDAQLKSYLAVDPTDCPPSHPWKDHYWVLDEPQTITREQIQGVIPADATAAKVEAAPAVKVAPVPVTTPAPAAKAGTNKKKWGDAELRALWEESIMPGVTQASLATKHGVKRQRIAALIKTAKGKFSTTRTHSGVKNSYGQLIK